MYVKRKKEVNAAKRIIHKIADVPGGVCIDTTGMVAGTIIPEATPIQKYGDGLWRPFKCAACTADKTNGILTFTAECPFSVGDVVKVIGTGNQSVTITAISGLVATCTGITSDEQVAHACLHMSEAVCVTGAPVVVEDGINCVVDAWAVAVVVKTNETAHLQEFAKGIIYI